MGKYKFLFKPLFFIFSLIFACWMVLKIEQLRPSDFGRYEAMFKPAKKESPPVVKPKREILIKKGKEALKKLFNDYRSGIIDSTAFNTRLELLLRTMNEDTTRPH
ncbi:MAG: hypothetical protein K0S12_2252 [Bacteroidetes bacterium]|jgi:hypothetical protein|nr:hypothetical protein [Bacteroidota bacterium]